MKQKSIDVFLQARKKILAKLDFVRFLIGSFYQVITCFERLYGKKVCVAKSVERPSSNPMVESSNPRKHHCFI